MRNYILIFPVLFFLLSNDSVFAFGSGITYHGRLVDPNGQAVVGTNVQFRVQLRTPGNEN